MTIAPAALHATADDKLMEVSANNTKLISTHIQNIRKHSNKIKLHPDGKRTLNNGIYGHESRPPERTVSTDPDPKSVAWV